MEIPGIKVWWEISCCMIFGPLERYIYQNVLFQLDFCIWQCIECQNNWFLECVFLFQNMLNRTYPKSLFFFAREESWSLIKTWRIVDKLGCKGLPGGLNLHLTLILRRNTCNLRFQGDKAQRIHFFVSAKLAFYHFVELLNWLFYETPPTGPWGRYGTV